MFIYNETLRLNGIFIVVKQYIFIITNIHTPW